MKKYQIYCWTNIITLKSYVGYSGQGVLTRWHKHLLNASSGCDTYFYRSIRKYGPENWKCEILFETDDKQEAVIFEKYFIKKVNCLSPLGYNSSVGGTGGNTWFGPRSEERKKLISSKTSGENNPRFSGFTDEQILEVAINLYETLGYWSKTKWMDFCKNNNYPQHLTKFRFKEFGGYYSGFKNALKIELEKRGHINVDLTYKITEESRMKISKSNSGKVWATYVETGKSSQINPDLIDGINIIKGRIKYVKN